MLKVKNLLISLIIATTMLCSIGCGLIEEDVDDDDDDNGITITVVKGSYVYFDLENKEAIDESDASTDVWDLRFAGGSFILTNGGETANDLTSDGKGAVFFTGSTDFNVSVDVSPDIPASYYTQECTTDIKPWIVGHGGPKQYLVNLLGFPGYENGDGLGVGTAYSDSYSHLNNDIYPKYYINTGPPPNYMPPIYTMTNRVYVVKHGDGIGYSKLQFLQMEYFTVDEITTYVFKIKCQNLN